VQLPEEKRLTSFAYKQKRKKKAERKKTDRNFQKERGKIEASHLVG